MIQRLQMLGIGVQIGAVTALDGVDIEGRGGEMVMLAGPNGAGKTTLLRVLLGLVRPDRGTVLVDGRARSADHDLRARLGYLPESVAFAENLSGRQVVRFFAAARGIDRRRVDVILDRVGLAHAARRGVRGYSRGMRQRLGLAVALCAEPELLLLDEPTGGLDQEGLEILWTVLDEWRAAGRMVLVSSHDFTLMDRHADRVYLLARGRVRAEGAPATLREQAGLPVQVRLVLGESVDEVTALVRRLHAWREGAIASDGTGRLRIQLPASELLPLFEIQSAHQGAIKSIRVEEPGLDRCCERLLAADRAAQPEVAS